MMKRVVGGIFVLSCLACGAGADGVIAEMEAGADAVCACEDAACADEKIKPVNQMANEYSLRKEKKEEKASWTQDERDRFDDARRRANECQTKIKFVQ